MHELGGRAVPLELRLREEHRSSDDDEGEEHPEPPPPHPLALFTISRGPHPLSSRRAPYERLPGLSIHFARCSASRSVVVIRCVAPQITCAPERNVRTGNVPSSNVHCSS